MKFEYQNRNLFYTTDCFRRLSCEEVVVVVPGTYLSTKWLFCRISQIHFICDQKLGIYDASHRPGNHWSKFFIWEYFARSGFADQENMCFSINFNQIWLHLGHIWQRFIKTSNWYLHLGKMVDRASSVVKPSSTLWSLFSYNIVILVVRTVDTIQKWMHALGQGPGTEGAVDYGMAVGGWVGSLRLQQVLIKPRKTAAVHRRQSEGGLLTLVNIKSDHPP